MAKRRIKQGRSKDIAPNWQPIFLQGNDILEWAWWTYRTISCHPCNPSLRGEVCGWQNKDEISKHPSVRPIEKKEAVIEGYLGLKITVATYNVMTLRDCPNDSGQRGEDWKGALLREQFGQRRLHVTGRQETRGGSSGVIETVDYIRYIGAGDQGHHGCEIWLSKQMSLGESGGKKTHFDTSSTTILAEEPRMMFAHVRPGGVSLILCVAHTPHDGSTSEVKEGWWQQFYSRVRLAESYVWGDFNGRLGRPVQDCVGDGAGADNGERLIQLMEKAKLWAPTTYNEIHSGYDWTWTHPRGSKARLDYILLSQQQDLWATNSYVDTSLQTSLTVRDHELVVADIGVATYTTRRTSKRRSYMIGRPSHSPCHH